MEGFTETLPPTLATGVPFLALLAAPRFALFVSGTLVHAAVATAACAHALDGQGVVVVNALSIMAL
jgi:hypothetical protein